MPIFVNIRWFMDRIVPVGKILKGDFMAGRHSADSRNQLQLNVSPVKTASKSFPRHSRRKHELISSKPKVSYGFSRYVLPHVRLAVSNQSVFTFLYAVAMQIFGYVFGITVIWLQRIYGNQYISFDDLISHLGGWELTELYIISSLVALSFTLVFCRANITDAGPFGVFHRSPRAMTPLVLGACIFLVISCQAFSRFYDFGVWETVGKIDLVSFSQIGVSGKPTSFLPMLLYSCLWGPVVEEVAFRGVIMSSLKRYGKVFAVVTSSVLFALLHGSLSQGVFTFFLGIVLGFVACEYSVAWSLLVHVTNNVAAMWLPSLVRELFLLLGLTGQPLTMVLVIFWLVVLLIGVLIMVCNQRRVSSFYTNDTTCPNVYASWTTPWFLFVVLYQIALVLWRLYH
jgi:uncharacterized protein